MGLCVVEEPQQHPNARQKGRDNADTGKGEEMKDGEIWVVEMKYKGKWGIVAHFHKKEFAEYTCENHIAYENNPDYRVVKYIREKGVKK